MTPEQFEICQSFNRVTALPGSFNKRFINSLSIKKQEDELTDKQVEWMYRLVYHFRKQIPRIYEKHKSNKLCTKLSLK